MDDLTVQDTKAKLEKTACGSTSAAESMLSDVASAIEKSQTKAKVVETYVQNIKAASNDEELAVEICKAVESNKVFAFAEFLAEPCVQSLKDKPAYRKYLNLLELFAYGTYADAIARKDELPELSEVMINKLRQLTLVSMCTRTRRIPIDDAMKELRIDNLSTLHLLFINAVYEGVLQGRLDSQKGVIEVQSWQGRDVTDTELNEVCGKIRDWIDNCIKTKEELKNIATQIEGVALRAMEKEVKAFGKEPWLDVFDTVEMLRRNASKATTEQDIGKIWTRSQSVTVNMSIGSYSSKNNSFQVTQEIIKVQKTVDEEEEQRVQREISRRSKTQRGKKHN